MLSEYIIEEASIQITNECSHLCSFCYAEANKKNILEADLQTLIKIVDKLVEARVKKITLLGGDPASYSELKTIAKYIKYRDIDLTLHSNTLSEQYISLKEISKYFSCIVTTFHSDKATKHDKVSGVRGSFTNSIDKMKKLSNMDLEIGIAINLVPSTVDCLYSIINSIYCEGLHLDFLMIQRIVPIGRTTYNNMGKYKLNPNHVKNAFLQLERIKEDYGINIVLEDSFPICASVDLLKKYITKCKWGFTKIAIGSTGEILTCAANPSAYLGSVFDGPLLDIWNNSPNINAYRNNTKLPQMCKECGYLTSCGGGCRIACTNNEIGYDYLLDYNNDGSSSYIK